MKKVNLFLALALVFANLFLTPAAQGEGTRKLTLMVYMCGSNLESSCGSATEDIQEMLASMPASREISVLVLTGGSDMPPGAGYFGQENTGIYELASNNRIRRVAEPDGQNMGDGATLAGFLRWGRENRPADRYALIVWNHGGGPLEGVCWDETADMDNLTLTELTGALEEALDQKLDWIGFDACLMGSLEAAGMLAPYADYMIASQEMEPSFGWNYGFLRDLPGDADGAETGRRIVDAFFEGKEDSTEILTLACIDLAAAGEAIDALDPVFLPLSGSLDEESYLTLSARRMTTSGFGKAEPGFSATGYDLVDAMDLAESLAEPEESEETAALIDKLNRAVVYSRANEEGANGLTLYYPYANKESYLEKWKDGYAELSFSPGYQAYVGAFGNFLTGEALFRWADLLITEAAQEADGTYTFAMPLTAEQAENVVSAQLLILRDSRGNRLDDNCVLIASCRAELGADNVLTASWDGRCLYAEHEDGTLTGPISFRQTDDGKRKTIIARYNNDGSYELDGQTVFIETDAADDSEYPQILRIRTWDEATQSFSSRMTFSSEGYNALIFWNLHRRYPGVGKDNVLPDMQEWADDSDTVFMQAIQLPQEWRLRYVRENSGRQVHAMFRLLDSQQEVVCSVPVPVPNPFLTRADAVSGTVDTPDFKADLSCVVDTSPDPGGLHLEWTVENHTSGLLRFRVDDLVINGSKTVEESFTMHAYGGQTVLDEDSLGRYDAANLGTLESISGTLTVQTLGGLRSESIPFTFVFDHADLTVLYPEHPLAETTQNGVTLRLLGMEPDDRCGWKLYLQEENNGTEPFIPLTLLADGFVLSDLSQDPLEPGMSLVKTVHAENCSSSITLNVSSEAVMQLTYAEDYLLQASGRQEISGFSIWAESGEGKILFELPLETPVQLEAPEAQHTLSLLMPAWEAPDTLALPQTERLPVLAENSTMQIRLRRVVAGEDEIGLSLEVTNLSDRWIYPEYTDVTVNGKQAVGSSFAMDIPPHATAVAMLELRDMALAEGETVYEITAGVYEKIEHYSSEAVSFTLTPAEPFPMNQEGGTWINGEDFTAQTAVLPEDIPEPEDGPKALADTVLIPDDYAAYRISLDTGIAPDEAALIKNCKAAVVRKNGDGYLEILTLQDLKADEEGRVILDHPGLFPTVAGDPDIGIMTYLLRSDDTELLAEVFLGATLITRDLDYVELEEIRWSLDRTNGTASIISFTQDGEPYRKQSDLATAKFLTYEVLPTQQKDGSLPHLADMERRTDFQWYLNVPSIKLDGRPLQFALRPITKDDSLFILISVVRTDDTRYSLPMIPFPAQ